MKELVRCKPCGYVMEAEQLGDVCPACGMPRNAFEPYRERVALNRLRVLNLDLHPIAIHLSQTFVVLIPGLAVLSIFFPNFQHELLLNVIRFATWVFPLTLIAAFISGVIDGLFRFKTIKTPFLRTKIIYSYIILLLSVITLITSELWGIYHFVPFTTISLALAIAVKLGLLGKKLINVILPGSYPIRKPKISPKPDKESLPEYAE